MISDYRTRHCEGEAQCRQLKAESLISISVGQRPTDRKCRPDSSPERAISRLIPPFQGLVIDNRIIHRALPNVVNLRSKYL